MGDLPSKPNFVFVVPLRNPAVAQDWDRCVDLCADTLRSALNQAVPPERLRVILACRDFPEGRVEHPSLEIIRHPYPDPEPNWEDQHRDKYAKIRNALVHARELAPCYVMKLDADDLVSNRLAEYVLDDDNQLGYYIEEGYRWDGGARHLLSADRFYTGCGSSNILFAMADDLPSAPDRETDLAPCDLLDLGHNITVSTFAERGTPLTPVPFPAAIYRMNNGENISGQHLPKEKGSSIRPNWKFYVGMTLARLRRIFARKAITTSLRNEFSVPSPPNR